MFGIFIYLIYVFIYSLFALSWIPLDNFSRYGTFVFLTPLATIWLGCLALYALDHPEDRSNRTFARNAMFIHYAVTLGLLSLALIPYSLERSLTVQMIERFPKSFVATIVVYIIGQIGIWAIYFTGREIVD